MLRQSVRAGRVGCNPYASGACGTHSERSGAAAASAYRAAGRNPCPASPRARAGNISTSILCGACG
ncbi:MAG TPA: hypothetical protein VKH13_12480 [Steroidobacteraceae bacterium]|nr:hypothetical protein [Steroidobacteraceae bacterium]HMD58782.1 hypothetical protein [Steroidobacteraceae bacterium]